MASPAGGTAPLDPRSVEAFKGDASCVSFLQNHTAVWETTTELSSLAGQAADFDAVFFPGGHGPMFDLATDATSQALVADLAGRDRPVAAVCHGSAALVNVVLANGEPLLKGKTVTGFSNSEENAAGMSRYMPFMLETKLDEVTGGRYVKADKDWAEKVVVDGNVITGQNPASARGVGEAIVKAIGH